MITTFFKYRIIQTLRERETEWFQQMPRKNSEHSLGLEEFKYSLSSRLKITQLSKRPEKVQFKRKPLLIQKCLAREVWLEMKGFELSLEGCGGFA